MKRIILALIVVLTCTAAYSQNDESYINVTGKSEREIIPNEIYISITINEADNTKTTLAAQERQMISSLRALGIDTDSALQVEDMTSDLKNYTLRKSQVLATKSYTLKVSSAAEVAGVFAALGKLNISEMAISKVTHSDLEQIKMDMRIEAMQNALKIATTLAEAIGQEAGKAYMINDYNFDNGGTVYYNQPLLMKATANDEAYESYAGQPIEFKELNLNYSVNVRFHLE